MTGAALLAIAGLLVAMSLGGLTFIGALAFVLSRLDRRRDVRRRFYRMRRA